MPLSFICKLWEYSWNVVAPLLPLASMACRTSAWADEVKPDGIWRGNGGAALSNATGNTQSSSLTITADTTRRTADDKLSLSAPRVRTTVLPAQALQPTRGLPAPVMTTTSLRPSSALVAWSSAVTKSNYSTFAVWSVAA